MTKEEMIKQAEQEGNFHFCPSCKKVQPCHLTFFNPDDSEYEEDLICCLICDEGLLII